MADETNVAPEENTPVTPETNEAPAAPNKDEETIAQIIELIASLEAKPQRELMWFLSQEFNSTINKEQDDKKSSPEEQERKAATMSEAF